MAGDCHRFEVIHSSAAKGAVGGWKPRGLDDVRLDPQTAAQPQYRPGILWDVRLVKSKAQGSKSHGDNKSGRRVEATLRCSGKGANRTPPECIVPGLPQAGGERFFRRRKPALQLAGRGA